MVQRNGPPDVQTSLHRIILYMLVKDTVFETLISNITTFQSNKTAEIRSVV